MELHVVECFCIDGTRTLICVETISSMRVVEEPVFVINDGKSSCLDNHQINYNYVVSFPYAEICLEQESYGRLEKEFIKYMV